MRAYFVLLVVLITVLASCSPASASDREPQNSQNSIQSTDAAETEANGGRLLRTATAMTDEAIDPGDEERAAFADIAKKMGTGAKAYFNDKRLEMYVKVKSNSMKMDKTVQKFLKKKEITPDRIYNWFKLDKPKNQYNRVGEMTPEYTLWMKFDDAWKLQQKK